jgi:hypothetical protein
VMADRHMSQFSIGLQLPLSKALLQVEGSPIKRPYNGGRER